MSSYIVAEILLTPPRRAIRLEEYQKLFLWSLTYSTEAVKAILVQKLDVKNLKNRDNI